MLSRRTLLVVTALTLLLSAAVGAFAVEASESRGRMRVPDVESGAKPLWDDARTHARAWRHDALLLHVFAGEGEPLGAQVAPPFLYDTSHDPAVGNGRALAWTFAFVAPSAPEDVFFVSVGGDGSILYRRALAGDDACCVVGETMPDSGAPAGGLAPPPLDADEAVARLMRLDAFRAFPRHGPFQAFLDLSLDERGRPAWRIGFGTATVNAAYGVVDAETGDIGEVRVYPAPAPPRVPTPAPMPVPAPEPMPCCGASEPPCCAPADYAQRFHASVGPSRPAASFVIPVESATWARSLYVAIVPEAAPTPFVDDLDVSLADHHGRTLRQARGAGPVEFAVSDFPSQGLYELSLWAPAALRDAAYRVDVEVRYAPLPMRAPDAYLFEGVLREGGDERRYPLDFPEGRRATHATLAWFPASPAAVMELALLDEHGNEFNTMRDDHVGAPGGRRELLLDLPHGGAGCCMTLLVRHVGRVPSPQAFTLEIATPEPVAHDHVGEPHRPMH